MKIKQSYLINSLIIIFSSLLFIPFLGNVHLFDWDEINFAESAREMIVTQDYLNVQINFKMFWEKPPLFIWMQVLSMKIFGINEFAARFPNAVAGIVSLIVLFNIGRKHFNTKFGILWVLVYAGSILPHFYFKSGIIDPWFNLFIFLGIYYFVIYLIKDQRHTKFVIISAIFIGLATLTKGPVALLIFLISGFVWLVFSKFKLRISIKDILVYIVTFSIIGGFWFILQIISGNYEILYDFIVYQIRLFQTQDAGHGGFLGYHFIVLFVGVFPASLFALKAFKKVKNEDEKIKILKRWMMILFWVVLILFSIVKTKIIHYSSLAYFPLTFLAAYAVFKTHLNEYKQSKWITVGLLLLSVVFAGAIALFQYVGANKENIIESGIIKDQFTSANLLAETSFTGFEFLLGIFLVVGIITSLYFIRKSYLLKVSFIFIVSMIFSNLSIILLTPQAEKISQAAAIEFYEARADEDAYFITHNMKSYALFFYGKKQAPENGIMPSTAQQLTGEIDKPVYVVCRNNSEKDFAKTYPNFSKLYDKNGYVFWKRMY